MDWQRLLELSPHDGKIALGTRWREHPEVARELVAHLVGGTLALPDDRDGPKFGLLAALQWLDDRDALGDRALVDAMALHPRAWIRRAVLPALIPGNFFALVPGAIDAEKRGFAAIVRAVKKRDGRQAAEQYVKMMRRQGDHVVDVLAARGLFEECS